MTDQPDIHQQLQVWAQRTCLAAEDLRALAALPFSLRRVEREGFLVREGEEPTTCNLLLAGCAFRQKMVMTGSRQIVSFHFRGDFVDLQSLLLTVNDHNVQALTRCEFAAVPKKALLALIAERPSVALAMWYDTLIEGAIFREWVVNVGRRNARQRLAHLLCELAVRLDASGVDTRTYEIPLTQEQLADAIGMTAVHTNRTLQALRRAGVISMSAGRLSVHDWEALRAIGDFNERYLHTRAA